MKLVLTIDSDTVADLRRAMKKTRTWLNIVQRQAFSKPDLHTFSLYEDGEDQGDPYAIIHLQVHQVYREHEDCEEPDVDDGFPLWLEYDDDGQHTPLESWYPEYEGDY